MTKPTLAEWLKTLPNVVSSEPVIVTIGRTTYEQAGRYDILITPPKGSIGYVQKAPATLEHRIYVVGDLPASYVRSSRVIYMAGDEQWFIAGYSPNPIPEDKSKYHPWGHWFGLHRWDFTEPMEEYDLRSERPYDRMKITLADGQR